MNSDFYHILRGELQLIIFSCTYGNHTANLRIPYCSSKIIRNQPKFTSKLQNSFKNTRCTASRCLNLHVYGKESASVISKE